MVRRGSEFARKSGLEQEGDRTVVDQGHAHAGAEDALGGAKSLAEAVVERLGLGGGRGVDVAGPVALAGVAVEGELADAEDLAVTERLVHPPPRVVPDPPRADPSGEAGGLPRPG